MKEGSIKGSSLHTEKKNSTEHNFSENACEKLKLFSI